MDTEIAAVEEAIVEDVLLEAATRRAGPRKSTGEALRRCLAYCEGKADAEEVWGSKRCSAVGSGSWR